MDEGAGNQGRRGEVSKGTGREELALKYSHTGNVLAQPLLITAHAWWLTAAGGQGGYCLVREGSITGARRRVSLIEEFPQSLGRDLQIFTFLVNF